MRDEGLFREVIKGRMVGKLRPGRLRVGMLDELLEKYGAMKKEDQSSVGLERSYTMDLPDGRAINREQTITN